MKRWAIYSSFVFLATTVLLAFLLLSEWGLNRVYTVVVAYLPVSISDSIKLDSLHGRLIGPVLVDSVSYSLNDYSVNIEKVALDWDIISMLDGTLHLKDVSTGKIEYSVTNTVGQKNISEPGLPEIKLPIDIIIDKAQIKNIIIKADKTNVVRINGVNLSASLKKNVLEINYLELDFPEIKINLSGNVVPENNYSTKLNIQWVLADLKKYNYKGEGVVTGDASELIIRHVLKGTVDADLKGTIMDPVNDLRWQADIDIQNIVFADYDFPDKNFSAFVAHIEGEGDLKSFSVQTNLDAQHDEYGKINSDFSLTHQSGDWVLEKLTVNHQAKDAIESEKALTLSGKLSMADNGHFNFSKNNIKSLNIDGDWNKIHWQLDSKNTLRSDAGKFSIQGKPDQYLMNVEGDVQGHPVTGDVNIVVDNDIINIKEFKFKSKSLSVISNGVIKDKWDFVLKANIDEIGEFVPAATGKFSFSGRIVGERETPHIQLSVAGHSLSYENNKINHIMAEVDLDMADKQKSSIFIGLNDIKIDQQKVAMLKIQGKGYISDHIISVHVTDGESNADVSMHGKLVSDSWKGEVKKIGIDHGPIGRWKSSKTSNLFVQNNSVSLSNICLMQGKANICGEFEWENKKDTAAKLSVNQMPMSIIQSFVDSDDAEIILSGTFSGQALVNYSMSKKESLRLDTSLIASAGKFSLRREGNDEVSVEHLGGDIDIKLTDKGLQGKANWVLNKEDEVKLYINLPGWMYGVEKQDQAVIAFAMHRTSDLSILSLLRPELKHATGDLAIDVDISGTINKPVVNGVVTVQNGLVALPEFGITVNNISLNALYGNDNTIQINGFAESAKGELSLNGKIDLANIENNLENIDKIDVNIELSGKDFEIVNLPEAQVFVSPDLQLLISDKRIDLLGSIAIPKATLKPNDASNTVSVSKDVVIINKSKEITQRAGNELYTSVRIDFGDDVNFSGFGVDGQILGAVVAVGEPKKAISGYGELNIKNGRYTAFEKEFELEIGRLNFIGNPITNPNINARAIKKIDDILVGVQVRGPLASPGLTLFSEPPMNDSNILSYLVVGVPIEDITESNSDGGEDKQVMLLRAASQYKLNEVFKHVSSKFGMDELKLDSGETSRDTSLHIGKYVNPQLYLNYSIGISNAVNIFQLRYKINSKWILQSESGEDTSADLLYTYEH